VTPREDRWALVLDLALYAGSSAFAAITAVTSTLPPHRAWGAIAWFGYAVAGLVVLVQLIRGRRWARPVARGALVGLTWVAVAVVPLLVQAMQRASGRTDRAQEEVIVVEHAAVRLLHSGTLYVDRGDIASWPPDRWLLGYTPYQPLMTVFGIPRAALGIAWWTDPRVWFALAVVGLLGLSLHLLRRAGAPGAGLLRAAQSLTVLPLAALTLATGGHDLPVVGLCLLALSFAAYRSPIGAGVAIGLAGAMKINAWPLAVVLLVHVAVSGSAAGSLRHVVNRAGARAALRYAIPAFGLPILAVAPALAIDAGAVYENIVRYSLLNRGLVQTTAQSPLPGRLLELAFGPAGRLLAGGLLGAAAVAIGFWLVRRPPRRVASAAAASAVGTAASILLAPSTRFGYLIYPIAIAMWLPALRAIGITGSVSASEPSAGSREAVPGRTQRG
jgi:glycosyl transferase family 87